MNTIHHLSQYALQELKDSYSEHEIECICKIVYMDVLHYTNIDIHLRKNEILDESFINKFTIYNLRSYAIILIIGIIGATPIPKNFIQKLQQKTKTKRAINLLEPVYVAVLLIVVTAYIVDNSYNPFLYFRF